MFQVRVTSEETLQVNSRERSFAAGGGKRLCVSRSCRLSPLFSSAFPVYHFNLHVNTFNFVFSVFVFSVVFPYYRRQLSAFPQKRNLNLSGIYMIRLKKKEKKKSNECILCLLPGKISPRLRQYSSMVTFSLSL